MLKENHQSSIVRTLALSVVAAAFVISGCGKEEPAAPQSKSVTVEEAAKSPSEASAAVGGDLVQGKQVYDKACKLCHDMGVAGAPKLGDKAAWEARLAKGMETLYGSAINGLNAMPPKGGNAGLSDEEVKNSVAFMVSKVQ